MRVLRADIASLLLCLLACGTAPAQEPQRPQDAPPEAFIEAQRAEVAGDHDRAERLYDEALTERPSFVPALMGRARMRSWLGRFAEAIRDYRTVVQLEPGNVQARSGLGWTLGWNRNYDEAREVFDYLLKTEPYYLDAQKGIAYIELWRGNAASARRWFEALSAEDQGNPDYVLAIAQAAYLEGDLETSRRKYHEALELKPDFEAARVGLRSVEAAIIERRPQLTLLGGRSEGGDVSQSGLRLAQIALQVNRELRLWASHDRGAGADGYLIDRRLEEGRTNSVGAFWNYRPRLGTRLEVGERELADQTDTVVTVEQVFFLAGGLTPKVGLWWADAEDSEWVANVGVHRWLTSRIALEPTVYYGQDGETDELRGALLASFKAGPRVQLGLGVAYGRKESPGGDSRRVDRLFGNLEVPIGTRAKFLFYGWREGTEGSDSQTVLSAGFSLHL